MALSTKLAKWVKQLNLGIAEANEIYCEAAIKALITNIKDPQVIAPLAQAAGKLCGKLGETVMQALELLQAGPAQDALCDLAIADPNGLATEICLRTGKRPSNPKRVCLFLFVTKQLEAYFKEDFEFQSLRLEYDRADAQVKQHVMAAIQFGDQRCTGFFGTKKKPLAECLESEIKLALESWLQHEDWQPLFNACLALPLKYSLSVLPHFPDKQWEPKSPEQKHVYYQILADTKKQQHLPSKELPSESSLFKKWLRQGREDKQAKLSVDELLAKLNNATPSDSVRIVSALATRVKRNSTAAKSILSSPYWLVRLAGYACCLGEADFLTDSVQDNNHLVKELSGLAILDFYPSKATPTDLETLSGAPAKAFVGRLGVARKILHTLMIYHVTTGEFDQMVVKADEFATAFVEADDFKLEIGK